MDDGTEPVGPEEVIYRRIATVFMRPGDPFPSPLAYRPLDKDRDGLSVYRANYTQRIEEVAYNDRGSSYYVGVLRAADMMAAGITIVPSPDHEHNQPGHAHLPGIRFDNRREPAVENLMLKLATELSQTRGPFPGSAPPDLKLIS